MNRPTSAARIIQRMANGQMDITLEAIARLDRTPATGYAAALLQLSGVIPPGNFERARLEIWEADLLDGVSDPTIRRLARQYAAWVINPRFAVDPHTETANQISRQHRSKTELRLVVRFLEKTSELGYELHTLPQRELDDYLLTLGGARRGSLGAFLSWARGQNLTTLSASRPNDSIPRPPLAERDWRLALTRLLTDETIAPATRLVGLFAVLFGLNISTIVALPRARVRVEPDTVAVRLGGDPFILPARIASLMRRHLSEMDRRYPASEWAFPGRHRGKHLEPLGITTRLRRIGVQTASAQATAMLQLARDIPAPVVADLLGFSVERAETWSKATARDWISYPTLRD